MQVKPCLTWTVRQSQFNYEDLSHRSWQHQEVAASSWPALFEQEIDGVFQNLTNTLVNANCFYWEIRIILAKGYKAYPHLHEWRLCGCRLRETPERSKPKTLRSTNVSTWSISFNLERSEPSQGGTLDDKGDLAFEEIATLADYPEYQKGFTMVISGVGKSYMMAALAFMHAIRKRQASLPYSVCHHAKMPS